MLTHKEIISRRHEAAGYIESIADDLHYTSRALVLGPTILQSVHELEDLVASFQDYATELLKYRDELKAWVDEVEADEAEHRDPLDN